MSQWDERLRQLISETNTTRQLLERILAAFGSDPEETDRLAFDLSELYGACLIFVEKIEELRKQVQPDLGLLEVDLAKLEATLEDLQLHLKESFESLPIFNRRLSDL